MQKIQILYQGSFKMVKKPASMTLKTYFYFLKLNDKDDKINFDASGSSSIFILNSNTVTEDDPLGS